jgi:hypothetical protein
VSQCGTQEKVNLTCTHQLIESRKTFSELHEARIVSQQTPSDIGSSTKIIAVTRSAVKNVNVVWHKEKGLMKKGLKLLSSNPS